MVEQKKTLETPQDGFALLAVLGFLVIVASVMTTFSIAAHNRVLSTKHDLDRVELQLALESVETALKVSWRNALTDESENAPNLLRCRFGALELYAKVRPLKGLIDLNAAGGDLLQLGLLAIGVDADQTKELSEAILAFRSRSENRSVLSEEPIGGLKHGLFESVSELHDFETIRPFPLWKLERVFTVHKRSATLSEVNAASELKNVIRSVKQTGFNMPFLQNAEIGTPGFHTFTLARLGEGAWAYRLATHRASRGQRFLRADHYQHVLPASTNAVVAGAVNNEPCVKIGLGIFSDNFLPERASDV